MSEQSGDSKLPERTPQSIAMITAWLSSSVDLMDAAMPESRTIDRLRSENPRGNETINGVVSDYDAMRDVAIELSLLAATALSCWANSLDLDPKIVLRDLAIRQAEPAHDTE